ncbi:MAG: HAMP domain-containing protein, partial [Candidatus Sumerlaeota bacterium]
MSASEFIHHPHRPSIRRRLMVATLLPVFLACLSLGLLVTGITYLYGRDMIVNHLNSQARSKHGEILSWTDDLQGELRFLLVGENSRNLLENILGGNAVSSQIAEARKLFQENAQACRFIEEIFLLSPEGYVLVSTNPAHEGEYRGHLEYFQEGQKKSSVHVQTSAASAEQLNRVFAVIPLMPEGNTGVGVLCGRASLDRLQSIISQYSGMGETAESFLVGENMVPLTFIESRRYSPGTSYIQSENIQSTIGESESQLRFAEDYRGVPVVGVYRWIPSIRAVLVIKQDQSEAFAPLRMTVLIQIVVALLAAIFAVALSMGLSRGIIHPINDLASATRAISMGEFRQRVQTEGRPEEIASLATAFNTMSDQIQRMFVETRRSEQRFRNLVETSIDWIWEIDPQGVCTYS